ncbi:hypothetical protein [Kocuria sp.]|uniref:hypothetical protein n=1 Tax=Kocuria sp. TaxID=1871328 RepID=UPI0026DF2837|nr:hypothetical protein [Kocuria sp.]MDO5368602.1 hypothetical protein [Kocuria sp.]
MAQQILTIGLMADPGLPEVVARSVASSVERDLNRLDSSESVEWRVDVSRETFPLTAENEIPLLRHAPDLKRDHEWDYIVYLTDLPRSLNNNSLVCEVDATGGTALVSLPAFGAVRIKSKTRRVLTKLVRSMQMDTSGRSRTMPSPQRFGHRKWRRIQHENDRNNYDIVLAGVMSRPRLLAGMVRCNRPLGLLPALSSSVAAGVATGAFGIFYASIWNMSDALSSPRMAMISVVVITAFSIWLIGHNGLWNPLKGAHNQIRSGLDNVATMITVGVGVAAMYLVIWAILLAVALAVVDAEYLAGDVGHSVNFVNYLDIAWLASALGMMGGALGLNFDSESAISEATYTRREYVRRQLAKKRDEQD